MLSILQRTNVGLLSGIYFQRPIQELEINTSQIKVGRSDLKTATNASGQTGYVVLRPDFPRGITELALTLLGVSATVLEQPQIPCQLATRVSVRVASPFGPECPRQLPHSADRYAAAPGCRLLRC